MAGKWIIKRMAMGTLVLIVVSFFSFFLLDKAPGHLAASYYGGNSQTLTAAEIERINDTFSLDRPMIERYSGWLQEVAKMNFGFSSKENRPVTEILTERVPNTVLLVAISLVLIVSISLPLGLKAGMKPNTFLSKFIAVSSVVSSSIPAFWLGLLLIWLFTLTLGILPSSGMSSIGGNNGFIDRLPYLVLPVSVIVLSHVGLYARFLQDSVLAENDKYYVLVARANGVEDKLIERGVLKNALSPYISYLAMTIPSFIGGSIIIESLFSWSGLGQMLVKSVMSKDFPLLMGGVMAMGLFVVVTLFIADCILYFINPKLRKEGYR
ncbi:ABC transporter permease [Sporosarcina sp. CAU 1771]